MRPFRVIPDTGTPNAGALMTYYPPLRRDKAFWGITMTQFLGAFNDNIFKMLLMLICADYVMADAANSSSSPYFDPYQTVASMLFASAFIMICGFAGYLSDRYRKKNIVVASKMAEIVVMAIGLLVFLLGDPGSKSFIVLLFGVLFLMGVQSAFFGPSKWGILPEMFSDTDLPAANGVIQATTFLAIIFGMVLAGVLKRLLGDELWVISLICVGLGIIGTITATMLRRTPAAQPTLKFSPGSLFVEPAVWKRVLQDRLLFKVLLMYSVFWFVGGVIALTITVMGKVQLNLSDSTTALFNASMGLGIGTGCIWAAKMSKKDIRLGLVTQGSAGLCCCAAAVAIFAILPIATGAKLWLIGILLFGAGFFGGWVAIPLQVFIQAHPPAEYKGRIIAVMNLMTWIGIMLASVYYFGALAVTGFAVEPSWILLSTGVIMLVAASSARLRTREHLKEEREVLAPVVATATPTE